MPSSTLLVALAPEVVHACCNALLSGREGTYSATAVAIVAGVIAFAPVIAWTGHRSDLMLALVVATCIAAYMLVDKHFNLARRSTLELGDRIQRDGGR